MNLAPHYRIVGAHEDSPLEDFICGAHSSADSDCRNGRGLCEVIEFLHGMSDFSAYRADAAFRELISWEGRYDPANEHFREEAGGPDKISLITENEYNAIHLNGSYVAGVNAPELSGFKVFTLSLDFDKYLEYFGETEEEDEFPGALWDIAAETGMIRPSDPGFHELLTLRWDYNSASTSAARLVKDTFLPKL